MLRFPLCASRNREDRGRPLRPARRSTPTARAARPTIADNAKPITPRHGQCGNGCWTVPSRLPPCPFPAAFFRVAPGIEQGEAESVKVIVIGGGVLGASAAFHLARLGAETVLVDAAAEGRATSAGAGIICPWASRVEDADHYAISERAASCYPQLIERLAEAGAGEGGYRRNGTLVPMADGAELDAHERRIRDRAAASPAAGAVTRLGTAETRRLFPALRPDVASVHIAGGARVDGRLLAEAMAVAATRLGATRLRGTARLTRTGARVTGAEVDGEAIAADAVLFCGGAWVEETLAPLGIALAVRPQRGQILHLRLPGIAARGWPTLLPLTGFYIVTFGDDRIVVGATREEGVGFDHRVTAGGLAGVLEQGLALAPGLADATMVETRIGFRPMGPDWKPLLGPVPGIRGLFIGNGLGPNGLNIGSYAGGLLAEAILAPALPPALSPYADALAAAVTMRAAATLEAAGFR